MMKLLISFIMFFFILNKLNKIYIQMIYQNFILFIFFSFMIMIPLNIMNFWMKIYYILGIDYYSMGLILLSIWIIFLMILSSMVIFNMNSYIYYVNLINFMLLMLILCFSTMNMILFYIFFESSLIPVFLLIMGWGYQVERIQAGFYMMLYTLMGSMPLFLIIMYLYMLNFSLMFNMIIIFKINLFIYLSLVMAFFIKMPMYFTHLWLPKAHVEAPLVGSMILAGVMLKLGSYGLMRVMLIMLNMSLKFNQVFMILSLIGGIFSSMICLCQVDMKMLVAYSSVVHMSILMAGMMTLFNWGYCGSYYMMIAHGLCSSGLFCLVNINYERLMSRSLYINKGMINYYPSLSLLWFFLCSSNLSFPPSLNLFGEIMLFNSLLMWSKMIMLILIFISFFSASYTLYLYSYSQHGKMNFLNNFIMNIKLSEYLLLILHWIPLNLMFLIMNMFI